MFMEPGQPITIVNPTLGTLQIGLHPSGKFDQWLFHEKSGGGAMAVGYTRKGDELYVMMLVANRFNLVGDEEDLEVPGGFQEGDEAALTGAARETVEETGIKPELRTVPGRAFVGNRSFFYLPGEDEGTRVFMFELTEDQAKAVEDDPGLRLMPWRDAVRKTRDALSGMAIARALSVLL
jgi:8-oxo-dGTP pyrophosphatase MutT (NUDIX family)